jgi:pyruvate,water dikinase
VATGRPGLEAQLVSGYGGVEETGLARGLWAVAGGTLTLQQFLAEHGHHGPREGELSAASWREDPAPLERTLKTIARLGPDDHPDVQLNRQSEQRQRLEGELLAALPPLSRAQARVVLRLAAAYLPLRERSRSVSHRLFDTARAHARHLGRCLAADGRLPDPEAVFSLTLEEALAPALPPDVEALVAHRRERRSHYQTLRIPSAFVGMPAMRPADEATGTGELRGVPVSPGIVAGPARVVVDPSQETAPIEPGEVLVCHVTDPSWMTLMIGAAALVTDVGSVISHAAIAARELGIPCVVGTDRATGLIRTGDHVRVDGAAGTVTIDHSEE